MPKYQWSPSTDTIDYVLERSVDRGLTWTSIVDVTHDYNGANYDSTTGKFFYNDVAAVLGEFVRIYGRNAAGDGVPEYLMGPVGTRPMCQLYGVLAHSVNGAPLRGVEVVIEPSNRPLTTLQNGPNIPATNHATMLGGKRDFRVFSGDDGRWSIDLIRGNTVIVRIPSTGFQQDFIVPEDRDVLNVVDTHIYRASSRYTGGLQNPWSQGPQFVP